MNRRPRSLGAGVRALLAVVVAAAVLVAGCGIATEDQAREIPPSAVPESLRDATTDTTVAPSGGTGRTVFLVRSDRAAGADSLERVPVDVPTPSSPAEEPRLVVEALVATRPDQVGGGDLLNAVPPDTQVLRADVGEDGIIDLDLTNLDTVEGTLQRLAVAQITFTLTQLSGITGVRFSVDGQPVAVPVESGTVPAGEPVERSDDPALQASLRQR